MRLGNRRFRTCARGLAWRPSKKGDAPREPPVQDVREEGLHGGPPRRAFDFRDARAQDVREEVPGPRREARFTCGGRVFFDFGA